MKRIAVELSFCIAVALILYELPRDMLLFVGVLLILWKVGVRPASSFADLLLGCGDGRIPSDSGPMTANIPSEAAKALGLLAPGDEAYIEVTEVNSDGSVVVMAEMEEAEDSAAPPPPMAGPALPPELGKMLGT